jgi:hypothetical protein
LGCPQTNWLSYVLILPPNKNERIILRFVKERIFLRFGLFSFALLPFFLTFWFYCLLTNTESAFGFFSFLRFNGLSYLFMARKPNYVLTDYLTFSMLRFYRFIFQKVSQKYNTRWWSKKYWSSYLLTELSYLLPVYLTFYQFILPFNGLSYLRSLPFTGLSYVLAKVEHIAKR